MINDDPPVAFPLVEKYHGIRLGVDLASVQAGRITVVESPRRLQKEQSHTYGYVRALWWLWLQDGRSALSVPPGAGDAVREIASSAQSAGRLLDPGLAERLEGPVNVALSEAGLKEVDRALHDVLFACNAALLRRHREGDCRRLTEADGIAYGVIADGKVVSAAFARRTGIIEELVADLGVEAAAPYRRRGYAKTAVSAVVEHAIGVGGEALYGCDPSNAASVATARSVGFVPYGASLILTAPWAG